MRNTIGLRYVLSKFEIVTGNLYFKIINKMSWNVLTQICASTQL